MIFVTVVVDQLYIMFWVLSVLNLSHGLFLQTLILCGGGLLKILVIVFVFVLVFFLGHLWLLEHISCLAYYL